MSGAGGNQRRNLRILEICIDKEVSGAGPNIKALNIFQPEVLSRLFSACLVQGSGTRCIHPDTGKGSDAHRQLQADHVPLSSGESI